MAKPGPFICVAAYTSLQELRDRARNLTTSIQILTEEDLVANRKVHIVTSVLALRRHRTALQKQRSCIIVTDSVGALAAISNRIPVDHQVGAYTWKPSKLKIEPIAERLAIRAKNQITLISQKVNNPASALIAEFRQNGILDKVQTWLHKIPDKSDRHDAKRAILRVLLGILSNDRFAKRYKPKRAGQQQLAFQALIEAISSDYGVRLKAALRELPKKWTEDDVTTMEAKHRVDAFELRYILKSYNQKEVTE